MVINDSSQIRVGSVMTKDVVAIDANDTLDVIAGLFDKYNYDGMPVVDANHTLLGIITTHDLILHSADVHLPTLLKILEQVAAGVGDQKLIRQHFGKLRDIKASAIMNPSVMKVTTEATLEQAAQVFADHPKTNPLCIVDAQNKLTGIISYSDIIRLFNETYLNRIVHSGQSSANALRGFPSKSEDEVASVVKEIQQDFLLVRRSRPLIWRYAVIAAFAAGLIAAAILVIHIAQRLG